MKFKWYIRQFVRIEKGRGMLGLVNFVLLLLVSTKALSLPVWAIPVCVVAAFIGIWLLGYTWDKTHAWHLQLGETWSRNPRIHEIIERLDRIERRMENE